MSDDDSLVMARQGPSYEEGVRENLNQNLNQQLQAQLPAVLQLITVHSPGMPSELDLSQQDLDVLHNPVVQEALTGIAQHNDRESFNRYLASLTEPRPYAMSQSLSEEGARAAIESDEFFRIYRNGARQRDGAGVQHLDESTRNFLEQNFSQLVPTILNDDRQAFFTMLSSLASGGFRGRELTQEQLRMLQNSNVFELMRRTFLRLRVADMALRVYSDFGGNGRVNSEHLEEFSNAVEDLVALGELINGEPASTGRIAALSLNNAVKARHAENGRALTQQECAENEGFRTRQVIEEMGFDLGGYDRAMHEDLNMPEDFIQEQMMEFDNLNPGEIADMNQGEVTYYLVLYHQLRYLQEQEEQRERNSNSDHALRSSPEEEEMRSRVTHTLRERLRKLTTGERYEQIINAIESGGIGLPDNIGDPFDIPPTMDAVPRKTSSVEGYFFQDPGRILS